MFTVMRVTAVFSILISAATLSLTQSTDNQRLGDNSDWWSIVRESSTDENLEPQAQDVEESNFRILGVTLGSDDLAAIQKKLGTAAVIGRGDASTGRLQICYVGTDGKTYLTFESGEVQYAFYLFSTVPKWSSSD